MKNAHWAEQLELLCRQRGGRGRGHGGHGNPWSGPWGASMSGPPPWVVQMFGPEVGGRPGAGGPRRARVRRGDVRTAILDVLHSAAEPVNGYQVIQQIAERTDGVWKPSPGSVYPTIAQLEDEGLVEDAPTGRKAIRLTEEGRAWAEQHAAELAAVWEPFDSREDDLEATNFKQVIGQTVGAIVQVATTGTPDQRDKALQILADTRRRLYGVLAEGPDDLDEAEDPEDADLSDEEE